MVTESWDRHEVWIHIMSLHWLRFSPSVIYTSVTCISWGGAQQHNRTLTVTHSLHPALHPSLLPSKPPLLWSLSEELSPAQWHVDVYNGDGWWLALPHCGTDGLLPKCLPASLHQSPCDSLSEYSPGSISVYSGSVWVCADFKSVLFTYFALKKVDQNRGWKWQLLSEKSSRGVLCVS